MTCTRICEIHFLVHKINGLWVLHTGTEEAGSEGGYVYYNDPKRGTSPIDVLKQISADCGCLLN